MAQVILLYTVKSMTNLATISSSGSSCRRPRGVKDCSGRKQDLSKAFAPRRLSPIAPCCFPASLAAKEAETRCEWTVAMMRIFEAMRLYAAAHDGHWPDRLGDITEVPIPVNPVRRQAVHLRTAGKQGDSDL